MADKTLLQLFCEALNEVDNPKLDSEAEVKTKNGYTYKYRYASLGECMRVVKQACKPLGLAVYFSVNCEIGTDNWFVYTMITDGKDEKKLSPVPVKLDGLPQSNGSEITYAKRYSLSAAFGLVSEEDDDAQMAQNQSKAQSKPKPVNTQQEQEALLKQAQTRLKNVLMEKFDGDNEKAKEAYLACWKEKGFSDTPEWFNNKFNEVLTEVRGA